LITTINRELTKTKSPKIYPMKKWANELNRVFKRKKSKWLKNT
jgi:hypothetical protein